MITKTTLTKKRKMMSENLQLEEARIITKVTSRGEKTKRVKCRRGFKLSPDGKTCIPITGSEKQAKKKSIRKAIRTKKAKGKAAQVKANKKRLKAMKKRKAFGLK